MKKIHIVVVNSSRSWGGTENWAVTMASLLQGRGHRVLFIGSSETVMGRARRCGLFTKDVRMRNDGDLWALFRFYRIFRRHRTDVLIATKWREFFLASLAGKLAGIPLIAMCLGLRVDLKDDFKRRTIFRIVDLVIVNATPIKEALAAKPWIDAGKIHVIYNGVDLSLFDPDKYDSSLRNELGLDVSVPLIGTVGSLTPQKGHRFLLESIPLVVKEVPQAQFVLVGDGFLRSPLEDRVRELGLGKNVIFASFRSDIPAVLKSIDFLVLSSDNEGMAWVILEAMAMGKAVVATRVSGTEEAVVHGETGLIVDYGNREEMSEAILTLIQDRRLRQKMGRKGRRVAEVQFNRDRMLSDTEGVLLRWLAHG